MEFIINNWYLILVGIIVVVFGIIAVVRFLKTPKSEQLNSLREWLLYATALAEKELGSGTGKLKLRYVYDMFVQKFPWLAKIIPFESFSVMVDEALEGMNDLLTKNAAVQLYVNGPSDDYEAQNAEG